MSVDERMATTEWALIQAAKAYEALPNDQLRMLFHFAAHLMLHDPTVERASDPTIEGAT